MNKDEAIIWNVLNNAQNQGIQFLIRYEAGVIKSSPEIDKWYQETKDEFKIIQKFKENLENGK